MSTKLSSKSKTISGLVIFTILAIIIGLLMTGDNPESFGLILVVLGFITVSFFIIPRLAKSASINVNILVVGFILKILFTFFRFWTDFGLYARTSDATGYVSRGILVAQNLEHFNFSNVLSNLDWGTQFIDFLTGVIFATISPTKIGGYFIFACISFMGSYFFYKAYTTAFPKGYKGIYLVLIFFFPSLLYWTNGIGKDAIIFFFIGLLAYGSSVFFTKGKSSSFVSIIIGLAGTLYIRPHIGLLLILCLAVGFVFRIVKRRTIDLTTFIVIVFFGGLLWFLIPTVTSFLGIEGFSFGQIIEYVQQRQELTSIGGSTFESIDMTNPLSIPLLFITIIFRPFLWEAHNIPIILQSIEGLFFLCIVIWRIKSIGKSIGSSFGNPYLLFAITYIIGFVFIFSTVQNFGILARERTMMFPFLFMLIAYTPVYEKVKNFVPAVILKTRV